MGTFIFIIIVLFFASAIIAFIFNKKKEKEYEKNLPEEILKTKKMHGGLLFSYINQKEGKTILRYFISKKVFTLENFIPTYDYLLKNCLVLFDENHKILSIIQDIETPGEIITIPFCDVISLQPVEISKSKKVTRGGISPITIMGYRWISVSTKRIKEISRTYIEMKYKAQGQEKNIKLNVFNGQTDATSWKYESIVDLVNDFINRFNKIVANSNSDAMAPQ